ncbi:Ornithine aminotransferase [Arachis hypogaea]|nr:Ornithine aminotransferase [Arachis hypogaea]
MVLWWMPHGFIKKPSHHREETHSSPLTTDRHSCSLSSLRFSPSPTLSHTTLTFAILAVTDDRRCCCTDHRSSSPFYSNRLLCALIADDRRCSDHRCCCATVTIVISVLLIIVFSVLTSLNMYGHCHPKILKALTEQAEKLTLSSRAFYNDRFPPFAKHLTSYEVEVNVCLVWAIIVSCCGCFYGRTLAVISMSCDNEATRGFGPLFPGHLKVDFGDAEALERIFKEKGEHIAGFLLEPIQGEAGVIIPPDGYLKAVRDLCTRYNVLMIADEIQTGLARTRKILACDWEEVRPDVVILGKALGGGVFPMSAVLADKDVMLCIIPGEHGSFILLFTTWQYFLVFCIVHLAGVHWPVLNFLNPMIIKFYLKELKLLSLYGSVAFDEDFEAQLADNNDARLEVSLLARSPEQELTEVSNSIVEQVGL